MTFTHSHCPFSFFTYRAIEKLHEIAEKVETQEEGSVIEDGELYKEMASTKAILVGNSILQNMKLVISYLHVKAALKLV